MTSQAATTAFEFWFWSAAGATAGFLTALSAVIVLGCLVCTVFQAAASAVGYSLGSK